MMSKSLVAYFSASGVTRKVANELSKAIHADLFEIVPKEMYTKEDLNWRNPASRSSVEMRDIHSRPEIASDLCDIQAYRVIYIGFPIWWYVAPTIIHTFLEKYDLSGKLIVPFATSGGSDMGKTCEKLKISCPGAQIMEGCVFRPHASQKELAKWADQFEKE